MAHMLYVYGTLKRGNKPKRAHWTIWAFTDWGLLASYIKSGAGQTRYIQIAFAIGNTVVAVVSYFKGDRGLSLVDKVCLALALCAILVLIVLRSPHEATLIGQAAKLVGIMPTFRKLWLKEGLEYQPAWLLWVVANLCNLYAARKIISFEALLPIQYSLQCLTVLLLNMRITFVEQRR